MSQTAVERRASVRVSYEQESFCQPLAVTYEDHWFGKIINLSRTGLALILNRRFERGTILVIKLENAAPFLARVVHSNRQELDWQIRCELVRKLGEDDLKTMLGCLALLPIGR